VTENRKEAQPGKDTQASVLIADDAEDFVYLVEKILSKEGYAILKSLTGKECIATAKSRVPDLILLDIMLPDLNGLNVCKRLKEDSVTRDIPVIFITAKVNIKDKIRGLNKGAIDYITKPFDPDELRARVKSHLDVKIAQDALRDNNKILQEYLRTANLANEYFEDITKLVDLKDVMDSTRKYFLKIFDDVKNFSVWLYDDTGQTFTLEISNSEKLDKEDSVRNCANSPIMRLAVSKQKVIGESDLKKSRGLNDEEAGKYRDVRFLCLPLIVEGQVLATVNLTSKKDGSRFTIYDRQKAISICQILANKIENCLFYKRIETLSVTDSLTKLYNRQFLDNRIEADFTRVQRTHEPFSVIMIDIDHFKGVNDIYGHQTGDAVLRHFSEILVANIRKSDFAARYGGEEFLILLPVTDLKGGMELAEKIRKEVEQNLCVKEDGKKKKSVTVSLGVAALQNNNYKNPDELIKAADIALYQAKREGRNRVAYADKIL